MHCQLHPNYTTQRRWRNEHKVSKIIGIIGGLSPESTMLYYQFITRQYYKQFQRHDYPEIIIYSVNFQKYIDWAYQEQWQDVITDLTNILVNLHTAGADFGIIACNTIHVVCLSKFANIRLFLYSALSMQQLQPFEPNILTKWAYWALNSRWNTRFIAEVLQNMEYRR